MQQDADFIIADFLNVFRASCAHHQEYKLLTRQLPVQVAAVSVIYTPDDGRMMPETRRESLQ